MTDKQLARYMTWFWAGVLLGVLLTLLIRVC